VSWHEVIDRSRARDDPMTVREEATIGGDPDRASGHRRTPI